MFSQQMTLPLQHAKEGCLLHVNRGADRRADRMSRTLREFTYAQTYMSDIDHVRAQLQLQLYGASPSKVSSRHAAFLCHLDV